MHLPRSRGLRTTPTSCPEELNIETRHGPTRPRPYPCIPSPTATHIPDTDVPAQSTLAAADTDDTQYVIDQIVDYTYEDGHRYRVG